MYDYPPILKGEPVRDLMALRDYLVRKERGKEKEIREVSVKELQTELKEKNSSLRKAVEAISQLDRQTASALRSLIIKTADTVEAHMDTQITELSGSYSALSEDYGAFKQDIDRRIVDTAMNSAEMFRLQESITTAMAEYQTDLQGQICRGILEDPDNPGSVILGIAISQNIQFKKENVTIGGHVFEDGETNVDGTTYYLLEKKQTLGFYSSTGWQFWIDGAKVGWFESTDRMLHVGNILVENTLQLGPEWLITTTGGFGIRHI